MSAITQKISALPVVVGRYDANFIKTADEFLNTLPSWANELNYFAIQANNVRDEVNNLRDETESLKNTTLQYKTTTNGYMLAAQDAWNKISSFALSSDTTYTSETIDGLFNALLTTITALQYQIEVLNEEQSKLIQEINQLKGEING